MRDSTISGSVASVVSTALLAACGKLENGTPYAPTNATSHWIWGERAAHQDAPSLRYTAVGYATHHVSAILWAVLYEKWFGERADKKELIPALAGSAAVAGLAYFVDYKMTPERLQPGFEKRLSTPALFLVFATFGASLAIRGLVSSWRLQSDLASVDARAVERNKHCGRYTWK